MGTRVMLRAALAALLLCSPASADEWNALTGDRIRTALSARVLGYPEGKTQNFLADGRTLSEGGGSSHWGRWRVEGDRYCSVWPPSDRWSCYGIEAAAGGQDLRFVSQGGFVTTGRYIDLQ